nr:MAG TPA: hypothetical protein [Caudoviricetes sp.]
MNTKKELTQEDINELLKDKEVLYLLEDLAEAKRTNIDIDIKILIKKGKIFKKFYTTRKLINNRAK